MGWDDQGSRYTTPPRAWSRSLKPSCPFWKQDQHTFPIRTDAELTLDEEHPTYVKFAIELGIREPQTFIIQRLHTTSSDAQLDLISRTARQCASSYSTGYKKLNEGNVDHVPTILCAEDVINKKVPLRTLSNGYASVGSTTHKHLRSGANGVCADPVTRLARASKQPLTPLIEQAAANEAAVGKLKADFENEQR
ncbi:hypothetical protein BDY19DRAFT_991509 [Irpex rosettiformis]|uniref:Uncharacterized protein n=1 Tax=Irpex rosettiformis TaxID=378272 RepID=A0ACB8U9N4_9APHY|nr:hypothetical protein BDY19DRAFT_991509 [Irpex rosettiformis]